MSTGIIVGGIAGYAIADTFERISKYEPLSQEGFSGYTVLKIGAITVCASISSYLFSRQRPVSEGVDSANLGTVTPRG